jgi:hemerythrin-like domain-containing protein
MAADLSMNQIIHAAVRRDLARTAGALRSMADGDGERAQDIQRAWNFLRHELKHHHEGEDHHIFPFLREQGADATLLDAMEAEHGELHEALVAGQEVIDGVVADPGAARATEAAAVIDASAEVVARHLEHEERDVEPLIDAHRGDPGFKEAEKSVRHTQLSKAGDFLVWVRDGATEREKTALTQTIPAPVVLVVGALFGRGYRRDIAPIWKA